MKPLPMLVALVLGVLIGYLLGRPASDEAKITGSPPVPGAAPAPEREVPAIRFETTHQAAPDGPTAPRPAAAPSLPPPVPAAPPAVSDGITNPIDAGPVFNQQFATAEKQGASDGMVEMHRALEREVRDDSWAYPLEAEIENSLVADTSMGNFRKEHLECRSTLCEIRLSAQGGAQIEALRQWTSDIQRFPWAARMQLSTSSTVSSDERMDSLLIVSKPPEFPESNQDAN